MSTAARTEFERCWPWLKDSLCEFAPTHTKEQVWERLCAGRAFFWPSEKGVIVGEIINHPIGLRSFNYWLQGGELDDLLKLHPIIEAGAMARGCHLVTGRGRDGWARVMGGDWRKGPTTRMKWLRKPPEFLKEIDDDVSLP